MAALEKHRAIVLKRTKYGEADLILHLLTPQGGTVSCLARGALKSKRRFAGGILEPTHYIEIVLRPSPRADGLGHLEEAKLLDGFDQVRTSYEKIETALSMVEMVDKIAQPGDTASNHLFDLLGNGLRGLQLTEEVQNFRVQFMLKLLYHQGVLDAEPWMGPFLKGSLLKGETAIDLPKVTVSQQRWVEEQVSTYLKTAERF